MADDGGADDIGDEGVAGAVPGEEGGAGAAATVELGEDVGLVFGLGEGDVGLLIDLVLGDAGGPEKANEIGFVGRPEAGQDLGLAGGLPFLPEAVGEDLDLGADAGLVVGDALERNAEGVVAVAALVLEQKGGAVGLGDQEVGRAVVGEVGGEEELGRDEMELVEVKEGADVGEAGGA